MGDRHRQAAAADNFGLALQGMRKFKSAIAMHQHAVAVFRMIGDRHREGIALNNLGVGLRRVRRFKAAVTACQDAVAIFRQTERRDGPVSRDGAGHAPVARRSYSHAADRGTLRLARDDDIPAVCRFLSGRDCKDSGGPLLRFTR
jgi:Tetratricopeptide repeat